MAFNYQNAAPTGDIYKNQGTFKGGYNGREQRVSGNDQPYRKKSGCQRGSMDDGRPWIAGWHGTGSEYVSFIANRGKDKGKTTSDRWESWIANFHNNRGQEWTVNCLYDTEKKRLKFPSLGWVANPSAQNGGYTGKGGVGKVTNSNR